MLPSRRPRPVTDVADLVGAGSRVAFGDGAGAPIEVAAALTASAASVGEVQLLTGWCLRSLAAIDPSAFAGVTTLMGGYAVRAMVDSGQATYLPLRFGTLGSRLRTVLRPDVLVAAVVRRGSAHYFGSEVSWQRLAVQAGARVLALERPGSGADAGPPLPADQVTVIGTSDVGPETFRWTDPNDVHRAIGGRVGALVPAGARVQLAPGALGVAVADALQQPVHIDTGVLTDAVMSLDSRGLLLEEPVAPYALGTDELYAWLDGRHCLHGVEVSHSAGRLAEGPPLFAINTGLEIDRDGQVNVESLGGSAVAGVGGQPDYAAAAAASPDGLSILAMPTRHGRASTLVDQLSAPVSTPSHDIDVVVTENGLADLRGLGRAARRQAISALWEG